MTDLFEHRAELVPPNQAREVVAYVAANLQQAIDHGSYDDRVYAELLLDAITRDAEQGLIVGLTPKFVDEVKNGSDEIPIGIFVATFAEGHYPISSPSGKGAFAHDIRDHSKVYRKIGRDKPMSDHLQSQALVLMERLEQSGLGLYDPANAELRHEFEIFGTRVDVYTTSPSSFDIPPATYNMLLTV